jgi:hypothetical protein
MAHQTWSNWLSFNEVIVISGAFIVQVWQMARTVLVLENFQSKAYTKSLLRFVYPAGNYSQAGFCFLPVVLNKTVSF